MSRCKWIGIGFIAMAMATHSARAGSDILIAAGTAPNVPVAAGVERAPSGGNQPGVRMRIMEKAPTSCMVYELAPKDMTERVFSGEAALRSLEGKGPVYLEMLCWIDGHGPFFSRARETPVPPDGKWRTYSVPFFLEPDMKVDRIQLGVRSEGPCTVELGDVRLLPRLPRKKGGWVMYIGPLLGMLGGLYGMLAGWLAPRGKGRALVMGLHVGLLVLSLALLATGLVLLAQGAPRGAWYSWLLAGIIGCVVFGGLLPVVGNRYAEAERRKMTARDL